MKKIMKNLLVLQKNYSLKAEFITFIYGDYSENSEPDKLIKEFIISYLAKSLLTKFNNLWFNNFKLQIKF